jgi:hypothetical protein
MASTPVKNSPVVTIKLKSVSVSGSVGPSVKINLSPSNGAPVTNVGTKAANVWLYQGLSNASPVTIGIDVSEIDPKYTDSASGTESVTLQFTGLPKTGTASKDVKVEAVGGDKKKSAAFNLDFVWFVTSNVEDVIDYIVTEMKTNVASTEFSSIKRKNDIVGELNRNSLIQYHAYDLIDLSASQPAFSPAPVLDLLALRQFANLVNYGQPWDHKAIITRTYGSWLLDASRGDLYNQDVWSNIHYGWIGTAIGFTEKMLLDAAGLAQAWHDKKKTEIVIAISKNSGTELDDPLDPPAIKIGINLWKKNGKNISTTDVLNAVRHNKSKLRMEPAPEGASPARFAL